MESGELVSVRALLWILWMGSSVLGFLNLRLRNFLPYTFIEIPESQEIFRV